MRASLENSADSVLPYEVGSSPAVQDFDVRVYLAVLRRRWLWLVLTALLVFAVIVAVAYLLPRVYEASAKILVESQQIPTDLAQPTVTANAAERIQSIEQRLMTRDNLLGIVRKFDLFPSERKRKSPSEIVDIMRAAAQIAPIDVGAQRLSSNMQVIGFTISFDYLDPDIASRVANEFVALILQQNIQSRTGRAAETSKFFQQQSEKLGQDLAALEGRIADFKTKNEAALPESLPYRRTVLLQLQGELTDIDHRIALTKSDQDQLSASAGDSRALQIQRLSIRLDATKQQLASATEERDSIKSLVAKGIVAKNRLLELDRSVSALQADVQTTETDIEAAKLKAGLGDLTQLDAQRTDLVQRISALNESILKTPEVEAALATLARDHDSIQTQYRDATAKVAAAATGEDLEQNRQAERFEVIEQATPPTEPIRPDRARIILGGGFASVAAGAAMVVLKELLDRSIRTAADLEKRLQLRPISTIPYLRTLADRARKRRRAFAVALLAVIVLGAGLGLIHWFYLPLDVLVPRLLTKSGLF